jgi:hypothetical protein
VVVSSLLGLGDQMELIGNVRSHKALSLLVAHHAEPVRRGWNKRGQGRGFWDIFFSPSIRPGSMLNTAVVRVAGRVHMDCTIEVRAHPTLTSTAGAFVVDSFPTRVSPK